MSSDSKTFFIVEDHSLTRDGLRMAMMDVAPSYKNVGEASTLAAAVDSILKIRPQVVFLDHILQDKLGTELIQIIQKTNPEIEYFIVTQSEDKSILQQYLNLGVKALISKFNSREDLRQAFNQPDKTKPFICSAFNKIMNAAEASDKLTPREIEVLKFIAMGNTNKEIAQKLNCSDHTIKTHKTSIMRKLECSTSVEISVWAIKNKIV